MSTNVKLGMTREFFIRVNPCLSVIEEITAKFPRGAARGGKPDLKYPWGNQFDARLANSFKTDPNLKRPFIETVPVRRLGSENGFDLFDMVGNAREWTGDFYDPSGYSSSAAFVDPAGPASGKERVVRGGSFYGSDKHLRISARDHLDGADGDNQTGFRCVAAAVATSN